MEKELIKIKNKDVDKFYNKVTNWLFPIGYEEVYSNHPLSLIREFHFSKDGIRVVCVAEDNEYCYLNADIIKSPYCLSLKTGKFEIGTDKLEELHKYLKENSTIVKNG